MQLKTAKAVKPESTATEDRYRALLEQRARSGLTLRAFGASVGVPAGTLAWWKHELGRRDAERAANQRPAAPTFLPVRIASDASGPTPMPSRATAPYAIVLGQRTLLVPAGFDVGAVTALVRAVEAASC